MGERRKKGRKEGRGGISERGELGDKRRDGKGDGIAALAGFSVFIWTFPILCLLSPVILPSPDQFLSCVCSYPWVFAPQPLSFHKNWDAASSGTARSCWNAVLKGKLRV